MEQGSEGFHACSTNMLSLSDLVVTPGHSVMELALNKIVVLRCSSLGTIWLMCA